MLKTRIYKDKGAKDNIYALSMYHEWDANGGVHLLLVTWIVFIL